LPAIYEPSARSPPTFDFLFSSSIQGFYLIPDYLRDNHRFVILQDRSGVRRQEKEAGPKV
jgi:hypothetical protein